MTEKRQKLHRLSNWLIFLNNHEPFVESERLCLSKLQIKSEKLTAENTLWTGCGLVDRDEKPQFCG